LLHNVTGRRAADILELRSLAICASLTSINTSEPAMNKCHQSHHSPALKKIRLIMSGAIVGISIANIIGANFIFQEHAEVIGASIGALSTAFIVRGF